MKQSRVRRNKHCKKNKKTRKTKIQSGGNRNIANSLEDFIRIIEKFEKFQTTSWNNTVHKNTGFDFSDSNKNTYYTKLISMIPCAIRLRDYRYRNTPTEYLFNSELELVSRQSQISTNNEGNFGSNDKIICKTIADGGFKIIMSDNTKYFSDVCSTQVKLVNLQHGSEGHAVILVLNHSEPKSFSVIDPNGGGTKVGSVLDDILFSKMLAKIMIDYKNEEIIFPPCQRMSVFMSNSCHIWSLLFTELIVRFSLTEAKKFFESNPPIYMNQLIAKYATYIMKVLDTSSGADEFIYSDYYIKAEDISRKISEVNQKSTVSGNDRETLMYKTLTRDEVLTIQFTNILLILLGYDGWILQITNPKNGKTYFVKSADMDIQELSTLFKAYPESFEKFENKVLMPIIKFGNDTINSFGRRINKSNPLVSSYFPKKGYLA